MRLTVRRKAWSCCRNEGLVEAACEVGAVASGCPERRYTMYSSSHVMPCMVVGCGVVAGGGVHSSGPVFAFAPLPLVLASPLEGLCMAP